MNSRHLITSLPPGTRIKLLNNGKFVVIEPDCAPKIAELDFDGEQFKLSLKDLTPDFLRGGWNTEWELHD